MGIDGDICGQLEDTRGSLWIFVDIASSLILIHAGRPLFCTFQSKNFNISTFISRHSVIM